MATTVTVTLKIISLDRFPDDEDLSGPEPDKSFIKSIEKFDVIYPVIVTDYDGKLVLIDGRRRVKAARLVGKTEIKAFVYDGVDPDAIAVWAMILNDQRSENIITEYEYLSQSVNTDDADTLWKEYSLNPAHVKKILSLRNIVNSEEWFSAYESGKITESTLFEIAKLGESRQRYLRNILETKNKLTQGDVQQAKRAQLESALTTMPAFNLSTEETTPSLMLFAIQLLGEDTATVYTDIHEAYRVKEETYGAKLYRMIEV